MAPNSAVQDTALELLDMLEITEEFRESNRQRLDSARALVMSHGYEATRAMFPDLFAPVPMGQEGSEEDAETEWSVPTPEQDEEISRWIAEQQVGSFTGSEWH